MAFAGLTPDQIDETEFSKIAVPVAGQAGRSLLQYEAYASTVVFLEALKRVGRLLDRAALVQALEGLRDIRTGVLPPITFRRDRHDGLSGAAVIGVAANGQARFLSPWRPGAANAPDPE
ncbi:MAG: ABC transporter substrate-binding protein [Acetobacteraceae bacterium]|nr:ABC transporter substrate-binding protein [Acetobacteraceae bacterium]